MGKTIRDELKDKYLQMGGRQEDLTNSSQTIDGMIHAINKLDGGGMSNDVLCINIVDDPKLAGHQITDITYADFNNALLNNKVIILKIGLSFLKYSGRTVKNGHTYVYFVKSADIDDDNTENTTLVLRKTKWAIDFDNSDEDGVGELSATVYKYICTVDDIVVTMDS